MAKRKKEIEKHLVKSIGFYNRNGRTLQIFEAMRDCEIPLKTKKSPVKIIIIKTHKGDLFAKDHMNDEIFLIDRDTFEKTCKKIEYYKGDKNEKRQKPEPTTQKNDVQKTT